MRKKLNKKEKIEYTTSQIVGIIICGPMFSYIFDISIYYGFLISILFFLITGLTIDRLYLKKIKLKK